MIGTVFTADGKEHFDVEVKIPMRAVTAQGSHPWRPPIARRRACRNASALAVSMISKKYYNELAKKLCQTVKNRNLGVPIKARPEWAISDAWHGSENNAEKKAIAGDFVRCKIDTKTYNKPVLRRKPLHWCVTWDQDCGKPAAKKFCQWQGYKDVLNFSGPIKASETSVISQPGQVCSNTGSRCQTFSQITCVR
jgi:hypothetical protein